MNSPNRLLLSALGGTMGALSMFVGDLFLYAHWGEPMVSNLQVIERIPFRTSILLATESHLNLSALLGAVATLGYLIGALHIYFRFDTAWKKFGFLPSLLFVTASVVRGVYHALWSAYGIVLQFAASRPEISTSLIDSTKNAMNFVNAFAAIPMMVSFLVLPRCSAARQNVVSPVGRCLYSFASNPAYGSSSNASRGIPHRPPTTR